VATGVPAVHVCSLVREPLFRLTVEQPALGGFEDTENCLSVAYVFPES
jgi:hypothetical protein